MRQQMVRDGLEGLVAGQKQFERQGRDVVAVEPRLIDDDVALVDQQVVEIGLSGNPPRRSAWPTIALHVRALLGSGRP
jgi:hypothetical protein